MTEKAIHKLEYAEFAALSSELIENSGGLRFRAHGRSMLPTIHDGDTLTLKKTDASELQIGDIVLIQNETNSLLAHRIIKRDQNKWTTCGDALSMHDTPFKADQLIGCVVAVEHKNKNHPLSPTKGKLMAAISRHSTTIPGRVVKRLMRELR